ncbi:TonB family protein [Coleofasciculus sp. FACHB-1120]|uniref:TonB family protein n=1 Tax=Coleofasciculus sp. FACHB-1120 TaxID=2692783 RepID=UPI001682A778|nr:TonB family protein [Coleofasciculus sp. FACHB-1120]MBD2740892.1 TonB family protein [Coleofasciculus sp. FACHB-1120]
MHSIKTAIAILGVVIGVGGVTPGVRAQSEASPAPTSPQIKPPASTSPRLQGNPEALLQQGLDKLDAGDYKAAVDLLSKVLEVNPNDTEAYYNRAVALVELEDYKKAIADYSKVLQLDPQDDEAYLNRGLARTELEDDAGAIADYSEVIKLKPDQAEAYYQRGIAYAQLEEDNKAIEDLQKASELFATQGNPNQSKEALLSIDVDDKGNVTNVRVSRSSGSRELDEAAVRAARNWKFSSSSGKREGVRASVDFQLEGSQRSRERREHRRRLESASSDRSSEALTPRRLRVAPSSAESSGSAMLSFDVDDKGNVTNVRLSRSSGSRELDEAAVRAARNWKFDSSSGRQQGVPASVDFQLEGSERSRCSCEHRRSESASSDRSSEPSLPQR